jgi:hypothetical protein
MLIKERIRSVQPFLLPLVLAGMACSCAWMGEPNSVSQDRIIRVVVSNHSLADMNVFVERDGRLFRLGMVMSQQNQTYLIRSWMLGGAVEYRLVGDPVGSSQKLFTERLQVDPSAVAHWFVEPAPWLCSVVIR